MIIHDLRIENMFCFPLVDIHQLAPPSLAPNIVLFQGANGSGRSALLQCIKLAIGGVSAEIRQSVSRHFGVPSVQASQFLRGTPGVWDGIFHSAAPGGRDRPDAVVALGFTAKGCQWTLRRSWGFRPSGPIPEDLVVQRDGDVMVGGQAEEALSTVMPAVVLPWHLYDGEQAQRLTEGEGQGLREELESLFGVRSLQVLSQSMRRILSRRTSLPMSTRIQSRLVELDGRLHLLQLHFEEGRTRRELLLRAMMDCKSRLATIQKHLVALDAKGLSEERGGWLQSLHRQRELAQGLREHLWNSVLPRLPVGLPLQPRVAALRRVHAESSAVPNEVRARLDVYDDLIATLPGELFYSPPLIPGLRESQREELENKLRHLLEEKRRLVEEPIEVPSIPLALRVRAQKQLDSVEHRRAAKELRETLEQLQAVEQRAREAEGRLQVLGQVQESDRARWKELRQEEAEAQQEVGRLLSDLETIDRDRRIQEMERTQTLAEREELLAELEMAARRDQEGRLAADLRALADELAQSGTQRLRQAVGIKMTERFHELFRENRQVERIELDENLCFHYLDRQGGDLSRRGLSAGTQQLLALSFLWVLADLAGGERFVMIDTPVARLDAEHRHNMLHRYCQDVSRQVVLLATDTEIGARRLEELRPFIYRQFRIQNEGGRKAHIIEVGGSR